MSDAIHFLLNDQLITAAEPAGELVLDWLRRRQGLTGTKEGCKEGDCGACTVLVGELTPDGERVRYHPVTSCLMPLGEVAGKHLVTIEGLNLGSVVSSPELNPVQQAIIDEGASQCGFCTPGIVVSMTGLLMQDDVRLDRDSVKTALSGHLCRCTGYRSLKAAGDAACQAVGERTGVEALVDDGVLPDLFLSAPSRLHDLQITEEAASEPRPTPAEVVIAGGTDLYVQRGEDLPAADLEVLNLHPEMRGIELAGDHLRIGALTTFEAFAKHPVVRQWIPQIEDYMFLIASWQIRNRATLGGNVINASPIGDMTVLLLALEAQLVFRDMARAPGSLEPPGLRTVPILELYQGYKVLDKAPTEVLTEIRIPTPAPGTRVRWEKVSKRKCLDIASVNSAMALRAEAGTITHIRLAVGGVAPIPLELQATREALLGRRIDVDIVESALATAQREISPISDVRGSADYKRLLTRQLLIAQLTDLFPDRLAAEAFHRSAA